MKRGVVDDIRVIIQQKRPTEAGKIKQQGNQRNERERYQPFDDEEDGQQNGIGQDMLRLVYAWAGSLLSQSRCRTAGKKQGRPKPPLVLLR